LIAIRLSDEDQNPLRESMLHFKFQLLNHDGS